MTTIEQMTAGQMFTVIGDEDGVTYTVKDDGTIIGENDKGNTTNPIDRAEFAGAALKYIGIIEE